METKAEITSLFEQLSTADLLAKTNEMLDQLGRERTKRFASRQAGIFRAVNLYLELNGDGEKAAIQDTYNELTSDSQDVTTTEQKTVIAKPRKYTRVPEQSNRHHVTVDGVWFYSVKQAFIDLNLDYKKHIPFRLRLKKSDCGVLVEYGMTWELCALSKEEYYGQTQKI